MADRIEPFMIGVDGAALDDLHDRVRRARWPERETVGDWSQGVPLGYLQDLCGYWASRYEWRATEATITEIESELPYPLTRVAEDIRAVLASKSFHDRITDRLAAGHAANDT